MQTCTYTLIASPEIILGIIPDGADLEQELRREEGLAGGISLDRRRLLILEGVTLSDFVEEGDEVLWSDFDGNTLRDEHGQAYHYALIRPRQ